MIITRKVAWYRPYYVLVNGKWYRLRRIKFYKDGEIMVKSQSGWLETKDCRDMELELPIEEIKLKRKECFDKNEVFIISRGKEEYGNDIEADLYIPADMLGIHFVRHEIAYKSQVRAVYEGEQGIYITEFVKSLQDRLFGIREEYEKIYKEVDDTCLSVHKSEEVLAKIDRLKELAEEFIAERKRVHSLTIDDIEL